MPIPSITSLPARRARSTYHRPRLRIVDPAPRPAAHRAVHTAQQVAAIRRRRARVLTAQGWVTTNARLIVAGIAAVAVFAAGVVLLLGLADDRVRVVLAFGGVVGFLALALHHIAQYTTDDSELDA